MGFEKRRGKLVVLVPFVAAMIILGLEGKCCRAALIVKTNTTYECKGNGRLDECRIAEDLELELELNNLDFLMNPKVIRILQQAGKVSRVSGNPTQTPCNSRGQQYGNCIAPGKPSRKPETPGLYKRR